MSYYPVLKLSNAEMGALSTLRDETKELITPIIESKMIPTDKVDDWQSIFRTLGTYISEKLGSTKFIYDFNTAFEKIGEVQELIDNESEKNLVQHCIEKMMESNLNFIPCIHFDAPQWIIESVLASDVPEIAIRIRCHDFNSPLEDMIAERIADKIINANTDKHFIILIDFYDSPINDHRIKISLDNFTKIKASQHVLILTSCPDSADMAPPNSFTNISSRDDLKSYMKLQQDYPTLKFGDYTVRLRPRLDNSHINYYNTYLKIFYSTEDDYYIGKSTLLDKNGKEAFIDVCQEIVDSDVYKKPPFSAGDQAIKDCADGVIDINNHLKPIEYGINHHIELTTKQLL